MNPQSPVDVLAKIEMTRIVPLVVIDDPGHAVDLALTLAASGLGCAEIALRTEAAISAIAAIATDLPNFLVGAGTVIRREDVDRAAGAGAHFMVSPGFDDAVVDQVQASGLLPLPGVATPTEVQRAVGAGLGHLKFFPAGPLGGLRTLEALAGPFPGVRFMPSGGVAPTNALHYLSSDSVFAVSGSWMVPRAAIASGNWAEIADMSEQIVLSVSRLGPQLDVAKS